METGKTGKPTFPKASAGRYFKYAIGEIVLVVIGILIALSINNWNEQKKTNKYEVDLLVELQKTIIDEMGKMDIRITEHKKAQSSCKILVKALQEKLPYHDSIAGHFDRAFTVWDVNIRYSAFENVKSNGLLFINDEDARYVLLESYEVQIKFLETLMDRFDMYYYNTIAPEIAENFEYVEFDSDNDTEGVIPYKYPNNLNNRKHINILKKASDLLKQILNTEDRIMYMFEKLDEKLTAEIASKK